MNQPMIRVAVVLFWWAWVSLLCNTDGDPIASAEDWPQWRGPARDDVSQETGLLTTWPTGGPKQLWLSRDAGVGYSGPAISRGRLYIMGSHEQTEFLFALDAATGKPLWRAEIGALLGNDWGDGPRGTPTIDGEFVYAMGGQGTLLCARIDNGQIVWRCEMSAIGGIRPNWGYTESVLIDGAHVVCVPGGPQGAVAALNKRSGELVWQSTEFTDKAQYTSLIAAEIGEQRQYLVLTMKTLAGIAAKDGQLLWKVDWDGRVAVIPTPIYQDQQVYVTSGYGVGCKLIRLGAEGQVDEVYSNRVMKNHHGGVILVDGHLFGHSDKVGWVCQDFGTGEMIWSEKKQLGKGAIAYAQGHLYCLDEDDGTVALIEASPEGWNERGRFQLAPQTEIRKPKGRIWTHPVISNGKLYLRDQELIYCYDIGA